MRRRSRLNAGIATSDFVGEIDESALKLRVVEFPVDRILAFGRDGHVELRSLAPSIRKATGPGFVGDPLWPEKRIDVCVLVPYRA